MTASGTVLSATSDGICTIEFAHPKSNSLPGELLGRITDLVTMTASNPDVRVIVLRTGGEKAFCAGGSFDELASVSNEEEGAAYFHKFGKLLLALKNAPQPVIVRVHGKAVGGGVGLAAACDYVLAYKDADIRLTELSIGLGAFVIGPFLRRKLGETNYSKLVLTGTWHTAQWATDNGLYTDCFNSMKELEQELHAMSHSLAQSSPIALREIKKYLWSDTEDWDQLIEKQAGITGTLAASKEAQQILWKLRKKK